MVLAHRTQELHGGKRIARPAFTIEQALAALEEHPKRIAAATATISAARLRTDKVLGSWTAVNVLTHLRSCSDARGEVIPQIVAGEQKTLRAIDPRAWAKQTNYDELEFAGSLRAFTRQRARLVRYLKALPREGWSRDAVFTGFGKPRRRTVLFYAEWIGRHELAHVHDFERYGKTGKPSR